MGKHDNTERLIVNWLFEHLGILWGEDGTSEIAEILLREYGAYEAMVAALRNYGERTDHAEAKCYFCGAHYGLDGACEHAHGVPECIILTVSDGRGG